VSIVFTLIPLSIEHTETLVDQILFAVGKKNISSFPWDKNFWNFSKRFETCFGLWSLLEGFHIIKFLFWVPWDHMELLISWSHFLNKVMPNWETTWDLGSSFCSIRVKVLDNGFFSRLVIDDSGTYFSLKSHCHSHWSSLGLSLIFGVESLCFDVFLILIWFGHDDDSHGIRKFFRIFQVY